METKKPRKKKFTVGLWLDLQTPSGESQNMQIWSIQKGETNGEGLKWFTAVSAINEDEALKLGQNVFLNQVTEKEVAA